MKKKKINENYGLMVSDIQKHKQQLENDINTTKNPSELHTNIKSENVLDRRSKTQVKTWKEKIWEKFSPAKIVLVNIELLNGFHRTFITKEKEGGFKYNGKKYLFDNELKYYNFDAKYWCYDYHENFTLPIARKIPVSEITKTIEMSNITEVEYATNPITLERFITSKIAEGIMKGQAIDEFFKKVMLIMIILLITSVIHLFLFMQKSGMLQQVKLPFG